MKDCNEELIAHLEIMIRYADVQLKLGHHHPLLPVVTGNAANALRVAQLSTDATFIRDPSLCGEPLSESSYASPPTPVSGEAWQIAADHLCATVQAHGLPSQSDRIREAVEQYVEAANRYATPVSAGLGKQRRQIESSKTTDGPNAKAGIE